MFQKDYCPQFHLTTLALFIRVFQSQLPRKKKNSGSATSPSLAVALRILVRLQIKFTEYRGKIFNQ